MQFSALFVTSLVYVKKREGVRYQKKNLMNNLIIAACVFDILESCSIAHRGSPVY